MNGEPETQAKKREAITLAAGLRQLANSVGGFDHAADTLHRAAAMLETQDAALRELHGFAGEHESTMRRVRECVRELQRAVN